MTGVALAATQDLSPSELSDLDVLERRVERVLNEAGRVAGSALVEIRDRRLYRATHPSFEGYCFDRFGISLSTAKRMITAAKESQLSAGPVSQRQATRQRRERRQIEAAAGSIEARGETAATPPPAPAPPSPGPASVAAEAPPPAPPSAAPATVAQVCAVVAELDGSSLDRVADAVRARRAALAPARQTDVSPRFKQ